MRAVLVVVLAFAFFSAFTEAADACSDRCLANFDNSAAYACIGACDYCKLQQFNKKLESSSCKDACDEKYFSSDLIACKAGCDYAVGNRDVASAFKSVAEKVTGSVSDATNWVWNKANSFINQFLGASDEKSAETASLPEPKTMKKDMGVPEPKESAPHKPDALIPKDNEDPLPDFFVTRIRFFIFGNDKPPMDGPLDGPADKSLPLPPSPLLTQFMLPPQGEDDGFFPGGKPHDKPYSHHEHHDTRIHLIPALLRHRTVVRPLLLLCAVAHLAVVLLSITALYMIIRYAKRKRQQRNSLASSGNVIYKDLPKYTELFTAKTEKASLKTSVAETEPENLREDDRAPLTI